ncbi:amidohydrolase family protein [Mesorhizobium sp. GR13]|uniref:amidohydrolase family protein n=1 Tax=Mesorhizobium sp. GR13 TaxID=2562308 RepID=UPI00148522C9|nr:amidohydrolase family protein [Mesorhizobium sp. GR13]
MSVIDFRTHPVQIKELYDSSPECRETVRRIFGFYCSPQPMSTLLRQLDVAGIDQAVLSTLDCTTAHGSPIVPNEAVAKLAAKSDRLIGFASVDPNDSAAPATLAYAVKDLGLRGLNLDPALQRFSVADERTAFPVYEAASQLKLPVTIQMGLNWSPLARTAYAKPLDLEPVADAFPDLPIIVGHCAWPFTMEALALAIKYRNVYLDTAILFSGRPESSVASVFVGDYSLDVVEASLRDKIVFASDYPRVDPKRVARAVRMMGLRKLTKEKIMGDTAAGLLCRKDTK